MKQEGNPNAPWKLRGYNELDYTGDNNTRKFLTVYVFLLNGLVISQCSQIQKRDTLADKKSEYSEVTEVYRKIIFIHETLLFMVDFVEYTITMHVDIIVAILLFKNTQVSQQENHKYVCHYFIFDYVQYRTVKIKFVYSEENLTYPLIKNLSSAQFKLLASMYVYCE